MDNTTSAISASTAGAPLSANIRSTPHSPQKNLADVAKDDRISDSVEPGERDSNNQLLQDEHANHSDSNQSQHEPSSFKGQNLDLLG